MICRSFLLDQFNIAHSSGLMAQPGNKTVPERALRGQLTEEEKLEEVRKSSARDK